MEPLFILVLALLFDRFIGEPPNAVHPVAGIGRVASLINRGTGLRSPTGQFLYGAVITLLAIGLFAVPVYFLSVFLRGINPIALVVVNAVILKLTFSLRGLRKAATVVRQLLSENELDKARLALRVLVSRDTRGLSEPLVVSATVESVAENASDSFVAPLGYFLLFGVPGAIAYRVVNTFDAMVGYHGEYEYLGKFAGRLDDVVNFVPSRITAMLIVLTAWLGRKNGRSAWQVASSDHNKTESPNAGWPMAAMAGALDIRLEKVGYYVLGRAGKALTPVIIDESWRLVQRAMLVWVLICLIAGGVHFAVTA